MVCGLRIYGSVGACYTKRVEQNEPLEDVLSDVFDSVLNGIHTAMPGRVEKYYLEDQTADVLPLVKARRVDESGNVLFDSFPVLPRVPVIHPRGGGFFLHFPMAAGDFVMLVFQECSIDRWRAINGREAAPLDIRRHSLSNAVAYPGLYPTSGALTGHATNLVVGRSGGQQIHIQPGSSGEIRLGNASETSYVALAELVATELNRIKTDLTTLKAAVSSGLTAVGAGAAANGATGAAAFDSAAASVPSNPASVAATRVTAL